MSFVLQLYGQDPRQNKYTSFNKFLSMISTYSLSYFYIAYTLAYFTIFQSYFLNIQYGLPLLGFFRALYMALVAFGAALGALASRFVIQKYPKRQFLLILNGFAMFLGAMVLWNNNIYIIFLVRFCQGICVGLYSVIIPNIQKQICPPKTLNRVIAGNYIIFSLALILICTFAYKIGSVYDTNQSAGMSWQIICAFPLAIIAIQSVILQIKFPYQNTFYYIKNNRFEQAQKALDQFYKKWYVIQLLRKAEQQIQQKQTGKELDAQQNFNEQQINIKNKNYNMGNPLLLNRQTYFQRQKSKFNLMAVFFLIFLQSFSGIHTIICYSFAYSYNAIPNKLYFPIIFFLIMFVFAYGMPSLIQKVNRKNLIIISTSICALSSGLISYGMYYNENPKNLSFTKNNAFIIIGLILLMINYGCCVGPIFDIHAQEIVPKGFYYLSKAFGWGVAGFAIMGSSADWRGSVVFLIYGIFAVLGILINFKLQIQTKGKTKAQIQEEYQRMAL